MGQVDPRLSNRDVEGELGYRFWWFPGFRTQYGRTRPRCSPLQRLPTTIRAKRGIATDRPKMAGAVGADLRMVVSGHRQFLHLGV